MKAHYQSGHNWKKTHFGLEAEPNLLGLSYNDWDDAGFKTTLNASLYFKGEKFLDFAIKILFEDGSFTAGHLNKIIQEGWDGFFPIPNLNYVSVPSNIDFYAAIVGKIGSTDSKKLLKVIRDASYLKNIENDKDAIKLIEHEGFNTSLLREGGARKAFNDGWLIFAEDNSRGIDDFTLNILTRDGDTQPVNFKFHSKILPYDINILIGPNGVGKSHCLKSLVEYWLGVDNGSQRKLEELEHVPFDTPPNISRLILFSYSPFEEFTLDLSNAELLDKDAYKYFGFRKSYERDGQKSIGISRNLPSTDSVQSLLKAFADDVKFGFMPNWIGKVDAINKVLKAAIGYEHLAVRLNEEVKTLLAFYPQNFLTIDNVQYLIIDSEFYETLDANELTKHINDQDGVIFLKNGKRLELSSGQRLFCYIVINLAGEIRKDSLVIIDEPELFLHLTLEIKFIALLKDILKAFSSKAILATHSLAIAREVPTNCVHVFRKIEDGLDVVHPPFETFGGDMQRISTYVFGDDSVTKPFDEWIESKIIEYGNAKSLIDALGKELNEEVLIKILNSEGENGI